MVGTTAFLVLAHANPVQFHRLAAALVEQGSVFSHIDAKSDIEPFRRSDVSLLERRVRVRWGGFSIIEATLHLMREALRRDSGCSHLVLLSGDSYPLVSPSEAVDFLAGGDRNFINLLPMPAPAVNKDITRLTRYYFERTPRESILRGPWWFLNRRINRDYRPAFSGMLPHCGSQWWALTREAAQWVLDEIDRRPEYVRFCRHTAIPDEHFFHTLLANSPFRDSIEPALFYADFSGPIQPAIITEGHVRKLWEAPDGYVDDAYGHRKILFVRKLNDTSDAVAELIRTRW